MFILASNTSYCLTCNRAGKMILKKIALLANMFLMEESDVLKWNLLEFNLTCDYLLSALATRLVFPNLLALA